LPVKNLARIQAHSTTHVRTAKPLHARFLELECHGSAKVDLQVESEELVQEVKGNATVTLAGRAKNHVVRASGSAEVHAFELEADDCEAKASGSAEIEVAVRHGLQARASGNARIAHRGEAEVSPSLSGKGRVERA
jgi:hypothetical protein